MNEMADALCPQCVHRTAHTHMQGHRKKTTANIHCLGDIIRHCVMYLEMFEYTIALRACVCVRTNKTKENIIIWVDNEQTICARWTHSLAFSPFHFVFFFFFLFLSLASLSYKHIKIRTCQLLDRGFRSKFTTPFSFYHQSEYIVFRSFLRHRTCSPAKCVCPIVVRIFLAPLSSRIDWSK